MYIEKKTRNDILLSFADYMNKKTSIIVILAILAAALFTWRDQVFSKVPKLFSEENAPTEAYDVPEPQDHIVQVEITDGSTYSVLMEQTGIGGTVSANILTAASEVYDLASIRVGRTLDLVFDKDTDEFKKLIYQINSEEELHVSKTVNTDPTDSTDPTSTTDAIPLLTETWIAERVPIEYEVRIKEAQGTIENSLYVTALEQNIDERAIIELANVFQWSIDFAMDVRKGDTFSFIYEERYRDGEYIMPGNVLAARYTNAGTPFYAFYFNPDEDTDGHYDEDGNSVQKLFLKAPVAFKYISSGFTTGTRYVAAFDDYNASHRAIDYAAKSGTPVRSVGDGIVITAGWNGPYGNFISVRHNSTYTTNYAHLSGYAVKKGQRVTQGQTLGYVGSTGYSTGPHLHYEMVKNGTKINPLNEILPPGDPIKDSQKSEFAEIVATYKPRVE